MSAEGMDAEEESRRAGIKAEVELASDAFAVMGWVLVPWSRGMEYPNYQPPDDDTGFVSSKLSSATTAQVMLDWLSRDTVGDGDVYVRSYPDRWGISLCTLGVTPKQFYGFTLGEAVARAIVSLKKETV